MTSVTTMIGGASGNENASYSTTGLATVYGGNGNDTVSIGGGWVYLGNGNDQITVGNDGGSAILGLGNDTVTFGSGNHRVTTLNLATVVGANGSGATVHGGVVDWTGMVETAITGNQTLLGGSGSTLVGDIGGSTTFIGTTTGADTMTGGLLGNNLYEILHKGGTHTINWALGNNQLYVENLTWQQLQPDITYSGANTLITLDGGATKIVIVGHHLTSSDIKP
jgi:hypothetical protein